MFTKRYKRSKTRGVTLIEIMVSIVILAVAVIGASGFRYHTMMDARRASAQMTASRVALMLCESWRGLNGDETFNPATYFATDLNITTSGVGPNVPTGFTALGRYKIINNDLCCWATLSWSDVSPGLRALNIVVAYEQRNSGSQSYAQVDKTFKLTVYTTT